MVTPNLFPVVHPYKNSLSVADIEKIGGQCLFTNAYILYQNEYWREKTLKEGIHDHLDFHGIIAMDSGAFQQYMYHEKNFQIQAEEIESFQENVGTDFGVILDWPVQINDSYEDAKRKVLTTIKRAKDNVSRRKSSSCHWFGPIHGSRYPQLLRMSANRMKNLDFDVNAIGGLVKAFLEYRFDLALEILLTVKRHVYPNRPVHMFGLGLPQFFSLAIACGCDLMDSAAYILFAKENRYFTLSTGTKDLKELVEFPCHCPICSAHTPSELQKFDTQLRTELLAKHNLYLSFSELKTIRQAIREGNLWELVENRIRNHPNLVKAFKLIKNHADNFEFHEKIYKNHGRLFTSSESQYRPIHYRLERKLQRFYRPPEGVKYLLILPELDTNILNSPGIERWLKFLKENELIPFQEIHVLFLTYSLGLIPLELSNTFPFGQYEPLITILNANEPPLQDFMRKCTTFLKIIHSHYIKSALFIPTQYYNQFNEVMEFQNNHILRAFSGLLELHFDSRYSVQGNLEEILHYFKKDP